MKKTEKAQINRLLKSVAQESDLAARIEKLSASFLGRPYVANSLVGSFEKPEQLVTRLDGFDCVTFIETVLALALATNADEFQTHLIDIRYQNGEVSWAKRNHYMADWWRINERAGLVKNLTKGKDTVTKTRELNIIAGLPTARASFRVFPKRHLSHVKNLIKTGDFVAFGSAKKNLDVFHTGILIAEGENILLRHASRTAKKVIDQNLNEFLKANRMSGLIILRPVIK